MRQPFYNQFGKDTLFSRRSLDCFKFASQTTNSINSQKNAYQYKTNRQKSDYWKYLIRMPQNFRGLMSSSTNRKKRSEQYRLGIRKPSQPMIYQIIFVFDFAPHN